MQKKTNQRQNPARKTLLQNFFSLSLLQASNYIFPLITFPYLVRVLGPEKFGLICFAQALIQYFIIIIDYGFNLTATREISIHRHDPQKVSEIFSSVIIIKSALCMLAFLTLVVILLSFAKFRNDWDLYLLTFGIVVGNVLFPLWFFQGMEKMQYTTVLNIIAKMIFTISIFIFVRETTHYTLVPLFNSMGMIVSGILAIWLTLSRFETKFNIPSWPVVRYYLKDGWHIFVSQISVTFFTNTNTFILGLLTNNTFVGYFACGEKLIRAVVELSVPVSNTIFPHVSQMFTQSYDKAFAFLRKAAWWGGLGFIVVSCLSFFLAPEIVMLVLGNDYQASIIVVKVLAFLPLTIYLNNIFGTQILININQKKKFLRILLYGGLLNILLSVLLIPSFKHVGSSISVLCTEIFIVLGMYYFARRFGLNMFKGAKQ